MKDIKKAISDSVKHNKTKYLEILNQLVSYDSKMINSGEYGDEKDIQEYLKSLFAQMGAEVDAFEPDNSKICGYPGFNPAHNYAGRENVVAVFKGNGTGRSILFNGHSDIVPAGNTGLWTSPPFTCEQRGDRLYGRGTTDMKGGSAAAIMAIQLLKEMGVSFNGDVIFEAVVDEEGGGNGTIACCERGYRADGAVIMEPTRMVVMPANRGAFLAEFTVTGKPIHASLKGFGINAIEKAVKLIQAMKELEMEWLLTKKHPLLSNPTINFGQISGGDGASTVAAECNVKFDVEFFPSEYNSDYDKVPVNPQDIKKEVELCVKRACAGDRWLSENPVTINWYQETLCFETDLASDFVSTVVKCCEQTTGKAVVSGLPCGCDGAQLSMIGNMPVVVIGPGDIAQAHAIDECIEIEKYYQAIEVYANLIVDWVGIS